MPITIDQRKMNSHLPYLTPAIATSPAASSAAYLSMRGLLKSYDGKHNAVDGIDIDVTKGEFVSFLGPSGSGKTTTLMMIAGFETLDSGTITMAGKSITDVRPYRRNIGMVFQNYALFPHMSVQDNIAFPLRMRGLTRSEIARRCSDVLELVGLGDFKFRFPRELSGGQQQRVAIARSLVFNPDLLLLDEPLGALDKNLREQMQIEIKRIHREVGITTIYVTHDQTEAMTMSDRIAVFNKGRLAQVAPPLEVYQRPVNRFVARFIGDGNLFEGVVVDPLVGSIDVSGLGIIAAPPLMMPAGTKVDALVRTENVLRLDSTAALGVNSVEMTVASTIHYGDSVLVLGTCGSTSLRMRLPGPKHDHLEPGARLVAGWKAESMHVIPHERAFVPHKAVLD
jgi:putative spermidine/putrescine transport system ATP-binding protein